MRIRVFTDETGEEGTCSGAHPRRIGERGGSRDIDRYRQNRELRLHRRLDRSRQFDVRLGLEKLDAARPCR